MAGDFNVQYVAHLARIALTAEEQEKFGAQLANILGYIEKLNQLDVSGIEPTAHAVPLVNVFRADEVLRPPPTGFSWFQRLWNEPAHVEPIDDLPIGRQIGRP